MQQGIVSDRLVGLPRWSKQALALVLDAALCALTLWLAWCLRLERWVPLERIEFLALLVSWAIALPVFFGFGLYQSIFRYAGWNAVAALCKAIAVYGAAYVFTFTVVGVSGVPRSIGVLQPLLLLVAVGGGRLLVRLWLGGLYQELAARHRAAGVLIYGAGTAGRQLASALKSVTNQRLVGFVDDDPALQGRALDAVPIFAPDELVELIPKRKVREVLLALPSAEPSERKHIVERLLAYPVYVRTLPGLDKLMSRGIRVSDLQDLDITDLLGRDPVMPDRALMESQLRGKTVLVTGAGGSIGSELCRQILRWGPRNLLLLDHSEYALYEIDRELRVRLAHMADDAAARQNATRIIPLQGSVLDAVRLDEILETWPAQIIYHAAAYKHVPMVEHNVVAGLRNNVWGTMTCALAARRHGVQRFLLVSTDKAVRPTNVMGATKRLSEMVVQAIAADTPPGATCYAMVRFGNVLGSSGSVVPLFRRQIAAGGPITLTHREVTRYFMTIPEAAQLVIQASAMAEGGEVFVLDMGDPVRIYDLARRMVELSGLRVRDDKAPWGEIEIKLVGLRPGEKLYEELLIGDDTATTAHPRIQKAHESFLTLDALEGVLASMDADMRARRYVALRGLLLKHVTGYHPSGALADWVALERKGVALPSASAGAHAPIPETPEAVVAVHR